MFSKFFIMVFVLALINMLLIYSQFYLKSSKTIPTLDTSCSKYSRDDVLSIMEQLSNIRTLIQKDSLQEFEEHQNIIEKSILKTCDRRKRTVDNLLLRKYSCPETYKGSTFGYPYFTKGFVRKKCTDRIPLSTSTSVIIDRPVSASSDFINHISRTFHSVILLIPTAEIMNISLNNLPNNINLIRIEKSEKHGMYLNNAVRQLKTPFTLVAPFLARFDSTVDMERLLHVLESSKADIVGGATKDVLTGEWNRGCVQTSLKLHTLQYRKGYIRSRYECLYCDYTVSPFLVTSKVLNEFLFDGTVQASVYHDFFLQMKRKKKTVMICPDVMFYTRIPITSARELVDFSEKWNIKKIVDTESKTHWFGCRYPYKHERKMKQCVMKKTKAVPPCCRANLLDGIRFILEQCTKINITCELQEGTLLGAVKFHSVLPWERDADITVLSAHFNKFKDLKDVFSGHGYRMRSISDSFCCFEGVQSGGVMKIIGFGWVYEIYGQHKLTTINKPKTKIKVSGSWMSTPENPGLYVRNRYGKEMYQHAEHWMTTGKKSGWDKYESGSFDKCSTPGDHSCLDQFEGDGDLQFGEFLN